MGISTSCGYSQQQASVEPAGCVLVCRIQKVLYISVIWLETSLETAKQHKYSLSKVVAGVRNMQGMSQTVQHAFDIIQMCCVTATTAGKLTDNQQLCIDTCSNGSPQTTAHAHSITTAVTLPKLLQLQLQTFLFHTTTINPP